MKVFISWSGKRSKETSEFLRSWIRKVIQAAETWISLDIEKGNRWSEDIKNELEQSKIGIICLNKENLQSEWILFEAGALSKSQDAHVCTFLLDVNPADVKPPLGLFQHTLFNKDDVKKLVHTINNKIKAIGDKTIPEKDLDELFEILYPQLEEKLSAIKNVESNDGIIVRNEREILEEILQIVRATSQRQDQVKEQEKIHAEFLYREKSMMMEQQNQLLERVMMQKDDLLKRLYDLQKAFEAKENPLDDNKKP